MRNGAWYVRATLNPSEIGSEETGCQVLTNVKGKRRLAYEGYLYNHTQLQFLADGVISYGLSMNTGWELGRVKGARGENFVEMGYYTGGNDRVGTWPGERARGEKSGGRQWENAREETA